MLHQLKRHPFPVSAHFGHCLVLTYAMPESALHGLLPPGLELDTLRGHGFLATAMVQTERLRPATLPPACGLDFFLAGHRIFAIHRTPSGRKLRGLRILRSDTDRRIMAVMGNLLTHYNYQRSDIRLQESEARLEVEIKTAHAAADIHVIADLSADDRTLPDGSPFNSIAEARRYAGPLPYTFDHEVESNTIISIKGVRQGWKPRLVPVQVVRNTFVEHPMFGAAPAVLASAFHVTNIPYRWEKGVRMPIQGATSCKIA